MQKELDNQYLTQYKEYVRRKKDYVREFKIKYVKQMQQLIQSYNQINALPFCDRYLPLLADKIQ